VRGEKKGRNVNFLNLRAQGKNLWEGGKEERSKKTPMSEILSFPSSIPIRTRKHRKNEGGKKKKKKEGKRRG